MSKPFGSPCALSRSAFQCGTCSVPVSYAPAKSVRRICRCTETSPITCCIIPITAGDGLELRGLHCASGIDWTPLLHGALFKAPLHRNFINPLLHHPPVTPGDGLKPRGLYCVAPCKKRPKNKKPGCPFRSIRAFGLDLSVCRQVLSICDKRFVQPPDAVLLIGSTNIGCETCFIDRTAKLRAMHCIICCAHGPATVCQRYCTRG